MQEKTGHNRPGTQQPALPRRREEAIRALEQERIQRGDVFIRRKNANPQRLRELLDDPLTEAQLGAVYLVLRQGAALDDFDAWLEDQSRNWLELARNERDEERERAARQEAVERQEAREREELRASGFATDWEKAKRDFLHRPESASQAQEARARYREQAQPCPSCGAAAADLVWFYFETPPSTWRRMCGRAGWITCCEDCGQQVDFFLEVLN